jgi:hypothetical protein
MIPLQEDGFVLLPIPDQAVDRIAGAAATIDVVAKEDMQGALNRPTRDIVSDLRQQIVQEVETAVDVTNRIDPGTGGQIWSAPHHP